ncbi:hypothetical protein ILYODFUR_009996 [Ilyodon furcidens]|uniref:Uncharacterized protein n=1 Tax=Ilyodon furcidens TaxID=33524 RepID=A0ABV0VCS0_9TELE
MFSVIFSYIMFDLHWVTKIFTGEKVGVAVCSVGSEVHRLTTAVLTPPQYLPSHICLVITNLLCTCFIHFFASPFIPPSSFNPISSNSAWGPAKAHFAVLAG